MSYLNQLESVSNKLTQKRKKEYIEYNFGKFINRRFGKSNVNILEIGPGLGEFIEYCVEKGVTSIDIIEREKSIVNHLKNTYLLRNMFLTQDIIGVDSKLDEYDIIMMTQVLEHIPIADHIQVLKILYKHLKTNGVLIITVPNIGNPLATFERYYDYTHVTAFTEHSLEQMVDFANLKQARILLQPFRIPSYSIINNIRIIFQSLLHGLFKMIYIINGGVYPRILTTNVSLIIEKTV